jgi:Uncharacterized conserved protein (DUF2249)
MTGEDVSILDVRPMLASGVEPLSAILAAAEPIPVGGSLIVIAPFEPVPLFGALRQMGFSYESGLEQTGGYRILFTRDLDR